MLRIYAVFALVGLVSAYGKRPTVLQKIRQDYTLSRFLCAIERNDVAKSHLQYSVVTVFAPTNSAYKNFTADADHEDVVFYHLGWHARTVAELTTEYVYPVLDQHPPLWITNQNDAIYVNNAKILMEKSNYVAQVRNGRNQVLHVIDRVLDPVVRDSSFLKKPPRAYEFFQKNVLWNVNQRVDLFWEKVVLLRKESLYRVDRFNTFLVPVDDGFTDRRLQKVDGDVVDAHVIPNYVFFTRPATKDFPFETLADGKFLYVLVFFVEKDGKVFVKGRTVAGNSKHPPGEVIAEVVVPNIPVKNGVIHLISRPLVITDEKLAMFPYLPVMNKLVGDPFLEITYDLFKRAGLLDYLEDEKKKFTIFAPRNNAWKSFANFVNSTNVRKIREVMGRHVVESNLPFSMDRLKALSQTVVNLTTLSGEERFSLRRIRDKYIVVWKNWFVGVLRPDYECTNGIIHVVDRPFIEDGLVGDGGDSGWGWFF